MKVFVLRGIAKVTLWALVGQSPGRPLFPFQNPFESPVCMRPSQLPQVSGNPRKQEGVGARRLWKTKATLLGWCGLGADGKKVQREKSSHSCGLYLLMNLSVNKIQHSRNNQRPLTKQIPWMLARCQPAIILKALFIFQAYLRILPPPKPKLLANSHFCLNLHLKFTMRSI